MPTIESIANKTREAVSQIMFIVFWFFGFLCIFGLVTPLFYNKFPLQHFERATVNELVYF
jgi:hypothetical protein